MLIIRGQSNEKKEKLEKLSMQQFQLAAKWMQSESFKMRENDDFVYVYALR